MIQLESLKIFIRLKCWNLKIIFLLQILAKIDVLLVLKLNIFNKRFLLHVFFFKGLYVIVLLFLFCLIYHSSIIFNYFIYLKSNALFFLVIWVFKL